MYTGIYKGVDIYISHVVMSECLGIRNLYRVKFGVNVWG